MPLPIELVKAQLKVWEYKCVLIVGNPHWPYAYKTTETYTYEYAMLTPSPHKMKLVLTHHVDAHPIPYLHVEVATADKKSSYQKPDIMNKPILIGSLLELKIINERIHGGTQFPDDRNPQVCPGTAISYVISYTISYAICGGECQSETQVRKEGRKVLANGGTCAPL